MNIAFIGCGQVGSPLANHLQRVGHRVMVAARDAQSATVKQALATNESLQVYPPSDAVQKADVVFLATPFQANEAALKSVTSELAGKILVDCTNPVGPGLTHGLGNVQSGSEFIQKLVPDSAVVKAFTIYGYENFIDNRYPASNVKPVMMYCGQQLAAKRTVAELISQLGWEPLDVGGLEQALHLEHMTLLWIRMVRIGGQSPHTVWAKLQR